MSNDNEQILFFACTSYDRVKNFNFFGPVLNFENDNGNTVVKATADRMNSSDEDQSFSSTSDFYSSSDDSFSSIDDDESNEECFHEQYSCLLYTSPSPRD